jgi:hypothetical protein
MAFQLSPGVNVSEVDLTTVVPSVFTTAGAFSGAFVWGPAEEIRLIDSEVTLSKTFGKPDSNTAVSFFSAANFLSYGNNLQVVRAVGANSFNAVANTSANDIQVKNEDVFQDSYLTTNNSNVFGDFMAKYPGALGNSLSVSVCANNSLFAAWSYSGFFSSAPNTSTYVANAGGSFDEMHIVVIDAGGKFTGTKGTVLETFGFLSKASDAKENGASNYYKQVMFDQSQYVYAVDSTDYANTNATWGQTASNTTFAKLVTNVTSPLTQGTDALPTDGNINSGYALFVNKENTDISLIITGAANTTVQQYAIDLAASRSDCVAFVSPPQASVVNNAGSESADITTWLNTLGRTSTYAMADSGWKYQYDVYNNTYRWVPLNADIAGLCVQTDTTRDPWYSPAGFNRGAIKNAVKLAWSPSKTFRDVLYSAGVNPVVSFPGQGIILFGDKTLTNRPSAFDRIGVRRLFLVLEKAISQSAQSSLFELNDEFTRSQFISSITPFLRDIQGRNGIFDFRVVCDTTNNTPQVIDGNQFVGDIYIKPTRSINFVQLNFVAVATGVEFTTVTGASA